MTMIPMMVCSYFCSPRLVSSMILYLLLLGERKETITFSLEEEDEKNDDDVDDDDFNDEVTRKCGWTTKKSQYDKCAYDTKTHQITGNCQSGA